MKLGTRVSVMLAVLASLALAASGAAAKANFSGAWVMDAARCEGIPRGVAQTLTVKHEGDRVEIELKVKNPQGEQTIKDGYTLDGAESEFNPPPAIKTFTGDMPTLGKGRRTAKWTPDGAAFVITEFVDVKTLEGPDTMKALRTWTLLPDGKTLTVEQKSQTPNGLAMNKRVFVKQ
ncbi:MAG: hypothetical protein LC785_07025 [Acidobacteria bacterium]|nr:hypothetical protein [Acidobacteriota bacterium]MCA1641689.1 hypothetical protein [Acidobacteriota bacterium]